MYGKDTVEQMQAIVATLQEIAKSLNRIEQKIEPEEKDDCDKYLKYPEVD